MRRIKGVRKRLSDELGFLVSPVRIRDDLDLPASGYRHLRHGLGRGTGEVQLDRELAINPGHIEQRINGVTDAGPGLRTRGGLDRARASGRRPRPGATPWWTCPPSSPRTCPRCSTRTPTRSSATRRPRNSWTGSAKQAPKLVEELVPKTLPLSVVVRVLQELLREQIPVTNMRAICQTLAEHGRSTQDPDALTSAVRVALGRTIVQRASGGSEELPVITLDPRLEQILQEALKGGAETAGIEPTLAERLQNQLSETAHRQEARRPAGGFAGGANLQSLAGQVPALCSAHASGTGLQRSSGQQARAVDRGCRHLSCKGRGR